MTSNVLQRFNTIFKECVITCWESNWISNNFFHVEAKCSALGNAYRNGREAVTLGMQRVDRCGPLSELQKRRLSVSVSARRAANNGQGYVWKGGRLWGTARPPPGKSRDIQFLPGRWEEERMTNGRPASSMSVLPWTARGRRPERSGTEGCWSVRSWWAYPFFAEDEECRGFGLPRGHRLAGPCSLFLRPPSPLTHK